eukprot:gene16171-21989_t
MKQAFEKQRRQPGGYSYQQSRNNLLCFVLIGGSLFCFLFIGLAYFSYFHKIINNNKIHYEPSIISNNSTLLKHNTPTENRISTNNSKIQSRPNIINNNETRTAKNITKESLSALRPINKMNTNLSKIINNKINNAVKNIGNLSVHIQNISKPSLSLYSTLDIINKNKNKIIKNDINKKNNSNNSNAKTVQPILTTSQNISKPNLSLFGTIEYNKKRVSKNNHKYRKLSSINHSLRETFPMISNKFEDIKHKQNDIKTEDYNPHNCKPKADDTAILWEETNLNAKWFDFALLDEKEALQSKTNYKQPIFFIHKTLIDHMKPNIFQKEEFKLLENNYPTLIENNFTYRTLFYNDLFDTWKDDFNRAIAGFDNVYSTQYGLVVDAATCKNIILNGGCAVKHGKIFNLQHTPHYTTYDFVINIGSPASGTWHFPMEAVVALAYVDKKIIDKAIIHIPDSKSYNIAWLELLGIPSNRIISHPVVFAKRLLMPEMGRCGQPYPSQIHWLEKTLKPINNNIKNQKNSIILIKRSGTRKVSNFHEVENNVHIFANKYNLDFILHNDRHLPSIADQIKIFSNAIIVVAPHGAGQLFINFSPKNACIIEFNGVSCMECYSRIAYHRELNYMSYPFEGNGGIGLHLLDSLMSKCASVVNIIIPNYITQISSNSTS